MTRRTRTAALALSLAGGVYLAAQPAQASNMGFKLERDFDMKTSAAPGNPVLRNIYWVSYPLFNGLGDVADAVAINPATGEVYKNVCVGDPTGPPGPAGDGNIDALDAVCDIWTGRNDASGGSITFSYYDSATCSIGSIGAFRQFGQPDFGVSRQTNFPPAGTDLWTPIGYQVNITTRNISLGLPHNRSVIVGSHDPAHPGHTLHYSSTCGTAAARADLISMPYHSMYEGSDEILCGLEGVAWVDTTPADGIPDTCNGGIFDDQLGTTHSIQVQTFMNTDPALPGGVSGIVSQAAARRPVVGFSLAPPTPFNLVPGEAYLVVMSRDHIDTIFRSPHF